MLVVRQGVRRRRLSESRDNQLTELWAPSVKRSERTSSPVGQTVLDAVFRKLMSISRSQDDISLNLGICNLSDNVLVGEADDEAVLGRVVLVLGLCDETLSCVEVGLSLSELLIQWQCQ